MTLTTRLLLSALLLSLAAVAAAPGVSAECVGTSTTPTGATLCTDHPVDPVNTCEAVLDIRVDGTPLRAFACTDYHTGSDVCLVYVSVLGHGVAPLCSKP